MLYLNDKDIEILGINWDELVSQIEHAVYKLKAGETVQPIKPYLRFNNPINRIIAMPAYVGGGIDIAGIKWIASFPNNISLNLPRAHNVVILNNAATGEPIAMYKSNLLSVLRTAAVSGLMLKYVLRARPLKKMTVGIIGWGPIGRYHYKMCSALFDDLIDQFIVYDINQAALQNMPHSVNKKITQAESWDEAYTQSDIIITSTVSKERYINLPPQVGKILLNISLRDYQLAAIQCIKGIIVDDWEEVCRENTDIELLAKHNGLKQQETHSIVDVVCHDAISKIGESEPLFINPMGMAIFDITIAAYYYQLARKQEVGMLLE